jgi:hypothetical protein
MPVNFDWSLLGFEFPRTSEVSGKLRSAECRAKQESFRSWFKMEHYAGIWTMAGLNQTRMKERGLSFTADKWHAFAAM